MEYYINPMWFYWLHVIESLRGVCIGLLIISAVAIVVIGIAICDESDGDIEKLGKRIIKFCCFSLIISTLTLVFVPTKETMIEMMIARQVTPQNVEAGVEAIKGAVDYVIQAIQNAK